jgi:hypothetical protein
MSASMVSTHQTKFSINKGMPEIFNGYPTYRTFLIVYVVRKGNV